MLGCRVNTAIDLVESRFVRLDVRTDYLCQSEVNLWYIWFSFYGKMQVQTANECVFFAERLLFGKESIEEFLKRKEIRFFEQA